jgi:hypothetical protein
VAALASGVRWLYMATGFDGIERALVILQSQYTLFVGTYFVLLILLLGITSLLESLPDFLFFTFRVLSVWSINAMSSLLSFRLCRIEPSEIVLYPIFIYKTEG